jgi:nitrilase
MMDLSTSPLFGSPGGGCSAIYGPDGRQLSKDMPPTEEGLIITELDMDEIVRIRGFADPCGHYSRPDMLWLGVDWREKSLRVDGNAE